MIRHATLQRTAEIVMVLGIIALCQPWSLFLHRYGLTVIIIGLLTFMFTGWFGPKEGGQADSASEKEGHS